MRRLAQVMMAEPTQQDLQRWLHDDWLNLARGELWRLVSKPLPEERRTIRSFRALCLRNRVIMSDSKCLWMNPPVDESKLFSSAPQLAPRYLRLRLG